MSRWHRCVGEGGGCWRSQERVVWEEHVNVKDQWFWRLGYDDDRSVKEAYSLLTTGNMLKVAN
ncbi:hypothetical protein TSUD_301180 [Trifolium subterraneum]|uniref:Uncharacterized protein n=1 Tax=Trifolium subterraneum TaxID=3900 RepID=A0A2Z6NPC4_TRISU|nr:hypothetical protein TSUD_301180 [Trifolium subterraneum]